MKHHKLLSIPTVFIALLILGLIVPVTAQEEAEAESKNYFSFGGFWGSRSSTSVLTLQLPNEFGSLISFDTNLDSGQGGGIGFALLTPWDATSGKALSVNYDMTFMQGDWSVSSTDEFGQEVSVQFLDGSVLAFDIGP